MSNKPPAAKPDTNKQIRRLNQNVKDLITLMRRQADVLNARGIQVDMGPIRALKDLKHQIEKLMQEFGGVQVELTQLRALADTTSLITSTLDVDEVLNQVMDTVVRLTGAERGYIMLKNKETGELEFRVARGMEQEQLDQKESIVSRTVINQVAEEARPMLTDNASMDDRFSDAQSIQGYQLRSILAVPLKSRDQVMGVVYCDNTIMAGLFRQHELNLLTAFADQAAVAIDNARLFSDARAQLDEVTNVRDLMENIFSSVASGIMTLDADGTVIAVNATAQTITGLDNSQMLGTPLTELIPDDEGQLAASLAEVATRDVQALVNLQPTIDGKRRDWNIIISPLHDMRTDEVQGLAVVLDDLTEVKRRESQLAQVRRFVPMGNIENIRPEQLSNLQVEVREISSMFCDVRGFTSFSENLEPEDLMRVINRYLSLASDAVNLYEGIVDKYMGDAVTGLFNTQLNPQQDHAVRCVRAAMSMILDLRAQHEVMPEDQRLFYGTGIHTGPAVLGNVGGGGREEFSALGEAMELSKVLQENAGPAEVIISAQTYEQVKDAFKCEAFVPEKTKGYDIPMAYRVLGRKRGQTTGALRLDPALQALLDDDD